MGEESDRSSSNMVPIVIGCGMLLLMLIVLGVGTLLAFILINPGGLASPWRAALGL